MMFRYLLLLLCLLSSNAWAQIRKCIIDGQTVYTTQECPGDTYQNSEITTGSSVPKREPFGDRPPQPKAPRGYQSDEWHRDYPGYRNALRITVTEDAPILIYGRTDWCGYCRKLDRTVLADPGVQRLLAKFVKVDLNPENGSRERRLFDQWGGTGYPTLFVQHGRSAKPEKIRNLNVRRNDQWEMVGPAGFIAILQAQLSRFAEL